MKSTSIIPIKSFQFALKVVSVYQKLIDTKKEYVISKQLLRCGTSIGANVVESRGAFSRKDFEFKLSIAYREAKETEYWIQLLEASQILDKSIYQELSFDVIELQRLLGSALITLRKNQK